MANPITPQISAPPDRLESTIGTLLLIHDRDGHVRALDFHDFESRMRRLLRLHYGAEGNDFAVEDRAAPTTIRRAISDYFSGDLRAINSIPVTTGGTSFPARALGGTKNDRSRHNAELWGAGATVGPPEIRPCSWLWPMALTRLPLWFRATGSSALMEVLPDMAAASAGSAGCSSRGRRFGEVREATDSRSGMKP